MNHGNPITDSDAVTDSTPPNPDVVTDGGARIDEVIVAIKGPPSSSSPISDRQRKAVVSKPEKPAKRATVHRIIRGWTTVDIDTVDGSVGTVDAVVDAPPEPTTAPPASSTWSDPPPTPIRLQAYGTASETGYCKSNVGRLLLETGWGCRRTTAVHRNTNNPKQITYDCEKRVSYDSKQTYHVHIHALEDCIDSNSTCSESVDSNSKIHRRIICVPLVSEEYYYQNIDGRKSFLNDDQQPSDDFLDDLLSRIRLWKSFLEKMSLMDGDTSSSHENPPPTVSLIILTELPPHEPIVFTHRTPSDEIFQIVHSNKFQNRLSWLCQELNLDEKFYTPVMEHDTGKPQPPPPLAIKNASTNTSTEIVQTSAMPWWWKPQYTIDYCFESILQQIVKEESDAILVASSTIGTIDKEETEQLHPVSTVDKTNNDDYDMDIRKTTDEVIVVAPATAATTTASVDCSTSHSTTDPHKKKSQSKRTRKMTPMVAVVRTSHANHNHNKRMRH